MKSKISRRKFIQVAASSAPALALAPTALPAAPANTKDSFSFALLGDLHFDRPDHHDMVWLKENKPDDIRQIENYCRVTKDIHPRLFATVRQTVSAANQGASSPMPFVLHVGDLVEGLCGSDALARKQCEEAIAFVRQADLGAPFLFCKGNHDVTGPGAVDAYNQVLVPFVEQGVAKLKGDSNKLKPYYSFEHRDAFFAFFDAYDATASLAWLEAALAKRTARHAFVVIHPPVVPYGARATWHIFSSDKQKAQRTRLLELLGQNHAFVLGGHIHKYNTLVRQTDKGRFLQLAVSSIISAPEVKAKDVLQGVKDYTPEQIRVEPAFGKGTEEARHAVIEAEKPFVKEFEYADLPGYAVISVDGDKVRARIYPGLARTAWKTLELSSLLRG